MATFNARILSNEKDAYLKVDVTADGRITLIIMPVAKMKEWPVVLKLDSMHRDKVLGDEQCTI